MYSVEQSDFQWRSKAFQRQKPGTKNAHIKLEQKPLSLHILMRELTNWQRNFNPTRVRDALKRRYSFFIDGTWIWRRKWAVLSARVPLKCPAGGAIAAFLSYLRQGVMQCSVLKGIASVITGHRYDVLDLIDNHSVGSSFCLKELQESFFVEKTVVLS